MARPIPETPRLLLGTGSLLGVSRATRDRTLQVATRFAEPESLAVTISKALKAGAAGVVASPSRSLRQALAELPESVPAYALLPNVREYTRDLVDLGPVGAIGKRLGQVRASARLRIGFTALRRFPGVMRGDFVARVMMLIEAEAALLAARDLRAVVLAAPFTDLFLAGRHRRFFEALLRHVRRRFHALAGLETHNLGHLLAALEEWGLAPDFVIGPVNPRGLGMKPTREDVLERLARSPVPVLAAELRAGGQVTLAEGAAFARARGAHGLVPDLVDLEDLSAELRALRG